MDQPNQKQVWNEIASGWSSWRVKPRYEIEKFTEDWLPPSKILDIGCGNGRNLAQFAERGFDCHAIDFSENVVKEAEKNFEKNGFRAKFKVADAVKLPYRSQSFDHCLSIALLHHIDDSTKRKKALDEINRVLRPGGTALISVWNKYSFGHPHLALKPKETYIPWHRKGEIFNRYYYLFNHWEMKGLIESTKLKILKSGGVLDDNIVFLVGKPRFK